MTDRVLNRVMEGAKTPEGKIIAVLLALSLAFMTWNAMSISAFAGDLAGSGTVTKSAGSDESAGAPNGGAVTEAAPSGGAVVAEEPAPAETPSQPADNNAQSTPVASSGGDGGAAPSPAPAPAPEVVTTEITYVGNGGTSGGKDLIYVGDIASPASITLTDQGFVRNGYTMLGWAMSADGDVRFELGESIIIDAIGKGEPGFNTLYAVWKSNEEIAAEAAVEAADSRSSDQTAGTQGDEGVTYEYVTVEVPVNTGAPSANAPAESAPSAGPLGATLLGGAAPGASAPDAGTSSGDTADAGTTTTETVIVETIPVEGTTDENAPDDNPADEDAENAITFVTVDAQNIVENVVQVLKRATGEALGLLPEDPFRSGYRFVGWFKVDNAGADAPSAGSAVNVTGEQVTTDTVVTESFAAAAQFEPIDIARIEVEYYYALPSDTSQEVKFDERVVEVDVSSLAEAPKVIDSPASIDVGREVDPSSPVYYPSETSVTVTQDDLANAVTADDGTQVIRKRVQYLPYSATYYYVYKLKKLNGSGYDDIEREEVKGVMGATVSAPVKDYPYATLESVEPTYIDAAEGIEVPVYYERKDFTLSYNTLGGSYVPSVTAPYGTSVAIARGADAPTRAGYKFDGWYLDQALTTKAPAETELVDNQILYAKWAAEDVGYTIVYMKEKFDAASGTTSYVYDNSRTAKAQVGSEKVATDAPKLTNNISGYEFDAEKNAQSKVTIAADGSSVLKVYYKLVRYTLVFNLNNSSAILTMGGQTYSGSNYTISNVVVGQDIAALWPTDVTSSSAGLFTGWQYTTSTGSTVTRVTKVLDLTNELVAKADSNHVSTFKAGYSKSVETKAVEYWLQQPDGTYAKSDAFSQMYNSASGSNLSAKDLNGYTTLSGTPAGYEGTGDVTKAEQVWVDDQTLTVETTKNYGATYQHDGYMWTYAYSYKSWWTTYYVYERTVPGHFETQTSSTYTYRFYYNRNAYGIEYYDGGQLLSSKSNVLFGQDITGSDYNYVPAVPAGKEGYAWGGWYADAALTSPYTFATMPGNNLVLYANWIAPTYDISFDLGAEDAVAPEGFESVRAQTVESGSKIAFPGAPTREHYDFVGWYTNSEVGEVLYDWAAPVTSDMAIYAKWQQASLSYTVHYLDVQTNAEVYPEKVVKDSNLVAGTEVTEKAATITGLRADAAEKKTVLDYGDNDITFYYASGRAPTTYTVRYVLADNANIQVAPEKIIDAPASLYSVVASAAAVDKDFMASQGASAAALAETYYPYEDTIELVLGFDAAQNVITFHYANYKTTKVVVNYLDMDGVPLAGEAAVTSYEKVGNTFVVAQKKFEGYALDHATDNQGGSDLYSYRVTDSGELIVNLYYKKQVSVVAAGKSKSYDGETLASSGVGDLASVTGLKTSDELSAIEFSGEQTEVGTSATTPKNALITRNGTDVTDYYVITYVPAILAVSGVPVTINVEPDRWNDGAPYDGTERTIGFRNLRDNPGGTEGVEISNARYDELYGKAIRDMVRDITLTRIDAGFYTIPASTIRAAIALPDDANYQVTLNVRDGELTIPQAELTVETPSASKAYDGVALMDGAATVSGLVERDTAEVRVRATGMQVQIGSSANGYDIDWGAANSENYSIVEDLGTLEVTANDEAVVLTAPSASKIYDGTPFDAAADANVGGVTATGLPEDFVVVATASGSATNVGDAGVTTVNAGYRILDVAGNDVTSNFTNISTAEGKLTIEPVAIELTAASAKKAYDGTPLTDGGYQITAGAFVGEEHLESVTVEGSQTAVGSSANVITSHAFAGGTLESNYTITYVDGTLDVSNSTALVTISAPSASKTYDGTPLAAADVAAADESAVASTTGLPEGFAVRATYAGSQTAAGTAASSVESYSILDAAGSDVTEYFANVETAAGTLTVNPRQARVYTGSASKTYDGTALASAEAGIEGLVDGETATVTAVGSLVEVGSVANGYTISWGSADEDNYVLVENLGTLTVVENSAEVVLTAASASKTYDGTPLSADGVVATGLPEGFTLEARANGSQTNAGTSANVVAPGYVIRNAEGENRTSSFANIATVDGTLQVNAAPLTITTAGASKAYDGMPLGNAETSIEGLVNGETATVRATGSIVQVGEALNGYEVDWGRTNPANYAITENIGKLSIVFNPVEIVLTAASASKTYDGTPLEANEVSAIGLPVGFTIAASASGSQVDAGQCENVIMPGWAILDAGGADVTGFFTAARTASGTLSVSKARAVVTTGSASKEYDGAALTNSEAAISGLVNGESVDIVATGSRTEVGTGSNTYAITWTAANSGNYEIVENLGVLAVGENNAEVVLVAPSAERTYDGTPLEASSLKTQGVEARGLPQGFTVDATTSGSQTNVGSSASVVDDGYVIRNAAGEDRTDSFANVTTVDGTLTIVPKAITVTTGSSSKVYDGAALQNDEASIEGIVDGEAVTVVATGSQTDAGESKNSYEIEWGSSNAANYQVVEQLGTLTVSKATATVVIVGHKNSIAYDGYEHSVAGYDVEISNSLYTEADFEFSGTATASRLDEGTTAMGLAREQFANKNANFDGVVFDVTDGYQTIVPIDEVVVTVTGRTSTVDYDGTEHNIVGYDVEFSNPLFTYADFTFKGTAEAARTDAGTTPMGLDASQFSTKNANFRNVVFNVTDGYQTIVPIDVAVTVTGHSGTSSYDGSSHTASGYDVEISNPLYTQDDFTFSGTAEAVRTDAGTTPMGLVVGQFANKNPNFRTVAFDVIDGFQTIEPISATVSITGHESVVDYDGLSHSVRGYDVKSSSDLYTQADFSFTGTDMVARTDAGTTPMGLTPEQFANTNPNFDTVTFEVVDGGQTVNPISATVIVTGTNAVAPYDGATHNVSGYTAEASSPLFDVERDIVFSGTATASRTDAGTTAMGLDASQFTSANGNFSDVAFTVYDGYVEVEPIEAHVAITGHFNTATYDGAQHDVSGYDVKTDTSLYSEADFVFSGTAAAARTDEGTTEMGLTPDQFVNQNENFKAVTFEVTDGYQTIVPVDEVVVTITGHNDTVTFDGTEHATSGYDVAVSNPLYAQNDFTFTGAAEAARTDAGTTQMGLEASQFSNTNPNFSNVTFEIVDGYQTITPANVTVNVKGAKEEADFDGSEHTASGYTVETSSPLYTQDDFTFTGAAEAVRTDAGTTTMELAEHQFANANPNFGIVTFDIDDGSMTINPIAASATITGTASTVSYDGNEHSSSGYAVSSSTPLLTAADIVFSGTAEVFRTDVGSTSMGLDPTQFSCKSPNFSTVSFEVVDGYQAVTPIDATVTIVGANATNDYDGVAHEANGFTATASTPLFNVTSDIVFTGGARAMRVDAGTTPMGLSPELFSSSNPNFATVTFEVTDGYQTISPIDVAVDITGANNESVYDGSAHSVKGYSATASSSLYDVDANIAFAGTAEVARTDAGTTQMGLEAGQFSNTNPNFGIVSFKVVDGFQTVKPADVNVKITGHNGSFGYDGQEHVVEGYEVEPGNVLYTAADIVFSGGASAVRTDAGTTSMGLASSQFSNANPNFGTVKFEVVDGSVTVDPADATVTIVGASNDAPYSGTEHVVRGYSASADNPLFDVSRDIVFTPADDAVLIDGTVAAARTDAGTTAMGLAAGQFANTNPNFENVTFEVTDGYQTISPIDVTVTVTGHNDVVSYDGEEHAVDGYDVSVSNPLYLDSYFTFPGEAEAKRTDEGTTEMGLTSDQFENVNDNFGTVTFEVNDGFLQIVPMESVVVTITGARDSVVYDGTEHTVSGYTVSSSNSLYVEDYFTFEGNAAAARTDAGKTDMGLAPEQFVNRNGNFKDVTFRVDDGFVEVTPAEATVSITGHTLSANYDGAEHEASGYDVTTSNPLYTEADFAFAGNATAKRAVAGTTDMGLNPGQFSNTNQNFANVTFDVADGSVTIDPIGAAVTITGHADTRDYDGASHEVTGYDMVADTPLFTMEDISFSGSAVATRTDAGTTSMGLASSQFASKNPNFSNVAFTVVDGYQTVNPIDATVAITGHVGTASYDGSLHSVNGYDVETSTGLYRETDFTFSGEASAERTDAGTTNMGLSADQFVNGNANFANVTFEVTDGYQTVDPIDATVNVVGIQTSFDYDGEIHEARGYEATSSSPLFNVDNDIVFSGEASAERTDAGTTQMGLEAGQFANANPNFANVTFEVADGSVSVRPISATVTITGHHDTATFDGEEHVVEGFDMSSSTPLYTADDFDFTGEARAARTDEGRTDMGLSPDRFTNRSGNFSSVTFDVVDGYQMIAPADGIVVTITGTREAFSYDGQEHVVSGYQATTSDPLYTQADFAFTGVASAARTDAGTTDMGLAANQFVNTNPNFTGVVFDVTDGAVTVEPIEATVLIAGHNDTVGYDGAEHAVSGYDVQIENALYAETGFTFAGQAAVARTNAGTTAMGLSSGLFKNVDPNFSSVTFKVTDGFVTVKPATATVSIAGRTETVNYDGDEHVVEGYDVTIDNPLYTEADFAFSGNAKVARSNAGTTSMDLASEQFANRNENFENVAFNVTDGSVTVAPIGVNVTVVGNADTAIYDGQEHSVAGYTATSDNELFDVVRDLAFDGQARATRTDAGTTQMGLEVGQFSSTNQNFDPVNIQVEDGSIAIEPSTAEVRIVGHHDVTTYDGEEHEVAGYDVTIDNPLYTESDFSFSGNSTAARTDEGTTEMGLAASQFANQNPNFSEVSFEVVDGFQKIVPAEGIIVRIVGAKETAGYDGSPHTASGYEVEISNSLYTQSDFTFTGASTATRTDAGTTNMGLDQEQFANTNANFSDVAFDVVDGSMTIEPARAQVTIVGTSETAAYDGTTHVVSGYSVTSDNPLYTESDFTFAGDDTAERSHAGTTAMGLTAAQFTNENPNFADVSFAVTDGGMTITPIDATVSIVGANTSVPYDGTLHTASGYEATAGSPLFDVEANLAFAGTASASRSDAGTTAMGLQPGQFSNTNPDFGTVTFNVTDGYVTVEPIDVSVHIIGASATGVYDGSALVAEGFGFEPSTSLYTQADMTFNGHASVARTDAGSTSMGLASDQFANASPNFANVTFSVDDGVVTVSPRHVVLTSATAEKPYDGTPLVRNGQNDVTVTGDGWAVGEGASYAITGSQLTVGASENSFTYTLNEGTNAANYDIVAVPGMLNVTNRDARYKIAVQAASETATYDGARHTVSGLVSQSFDVEGNTYTVEGLVASASAVDAGEYQSNVAGTPVVRDVSGNDVSSQFAVSAEPGTLTIHKRPVVLTSASGSKEYDGTPLAISEVEVGGEGWADGEGATYDVVGAQTPAGNSPNAFTYTLSGNTKPSNYDIEVVFGTLTVSDRVQPYEATVKAKSDEVVYDGMVHEVSGFENEVDQRGIALSVEGQTYYVSGLTSSAAASDAGSFETSIAGTPIVRDAAGNDVSAQFSVTTEPGTLTVAKRKVILTSASGSKEYDGSPLSASGIEVGGDGWAPGEGAAYDVTGAQTIVGSSDNVFDYVLTSGTLADNYDVTSVYGTLSVTDRLEKFVIDVVASSDEVTYDGAEHEVEGFETLSFEVAGNDYTVEGLEAHASATNAGSYTSAVTGAERVIDGAGNDVTGQFTVNRTGGTLEIGKRSVILASASDSKMYDGTPLTNDGITVSGDGWVSGEGATYRITGTQTLAGVSENAFTYTLYSNTKAGNYQITVLPGMLTVTNRDALYQIVVEANSATYAYDGTEHVAEGLASNAFTIDGSSYTVEGLSARAQATDVGMHSVSVVGTPVVRDANGSDVTTQFAVTTLPGTLTIAKRPVVLTSASGSKEYDGTPLTASEVEVGGDGWAEGQGATYRVTGSQLVAGSSANEFTYELSDATDAGNYDITVVPGTLTINNRENRFPVSVTARSSEYLYDGVEKSVEGFETLAFDVEGLAYHIEGLEASVRAKDAGTYESTVSGTPSVIDAYGNDVTDQFDVTTTAGALTIGKRSVELSSANASKTYDGAPLVNDEIAVSGNGWAAGEGATFEMSGTQTLVGSSENAFTYKLTDVTKAANYDITTSFGELTVNGRGDSPIDIRIETKSDTAVYDGRDHVASGIEGTQFVFDGRVFTIEGIEASVTAKDAGTYPIAVTGTPIVRDAAGNDVTSQFALAVDQGTLTISKRPITLTSASGSKAYDGTPLVAADVAVGGDGWAVGEGATYDVTGTQTLAGSSSNEFTYRLDEGTNADNYDITTVYGTLTVDNRVEKIPLSLVAPGGQALYDGREHVVEGFETLEFAIGGQTFTVEGVTARAAGVNAGTYPVEVTGTPVVRDAAGNDVTAQFDVSVTAGQLVIAKRQLTVTTDPVSKPYDGTELTGGAIVIGGDGWAEGEGADFSVTGGRTTVGTSETTISYTLRDGTDEGNYDITVVPGTMTVTNRDAQYDIVITAESGSFVYDGTEHDVSGLVSSDVSIDGVAYRVEGLTASASATDAGVYAVNVVGTPIVRDASGNDVSGQFSVGVSPGTLTISKRSITMTSASDSKVYDGTPLVAREVVVSGDGLADGDTALFDVTGSQTHAGTSANAFTYTFVSGVNENNYDIEVVEGVLTVDAMPLDQATEPGGDVPSIGRISASQSGNVVYNGHPQMLPAHVTDSSSAGLVTLIEGEDYRVTYTDATNVGSVEVTVSGVGNYTGSLSYTYDILPASITVSTPSAQKAYDGSALTAEGALVGLVNGETATLLTTGSQTEVGSSDNTYDIVWNGTARASNYQVTSVDVGVLTVTEPVVVPEPSVGPEPEPGTEPEPGSEPEPGTEPEPGSEPSSQPEPIVVPANYKLAVAYVYKDGSVAAAPHVEQLAEGDSFDVAVPTLPGYVATDDNGAPVSSLVGQMPAQDVSLRVVYVALQDAVPAVIPSVTPPSDPTAPTTPSSNRTPSAATPTPISAIADIIDSANGDGPAASVTIGDDGNPLVQRIGDEGNPLSSGSMSTWSLFDVLATILTALLCVVMLIGLAGRRRDEDEEASASDEASVIALVGESSVPSASGTSAVAADAADTSDESDEQRSKRRGVRMLSIVPAVVAVILLFVTQVFTGQMTWFDNWSILFAAIAVVQLVLLLLSRGRKEDPDEDEDSSYGTATSNSPLLLVG